MFKEKKFLFRSLFWGVLGFFVILIYTQLPSYQVKHLSYIPADSDFVVLVNAYDLRNDYFKLLDENPLAMDNLEYDSSWISTLRSIGIVPEQKVGFFSFLDAESDNNYTGIVAHVWDNKKFVTFVVDPSKPLAEVEYKTGFFAQDSASGKLIFRKENDIVILSKVINQTSDRELLKEHNLTDLWDVIFNSENTLQSTNDGFAKMVSSNEHFSIWVSGGIKTEGVPFLGGMLGEKNLELSFRKEGLMLQGKIKLNEENGIVHRENQDVICQGDECIRMSMNLDKKDFLNELREFVPDDKSYILDNWNGAICLAVDEFKPVSLYKTESYFDSVKNVEIVKESDLISLRSLGEPFKMFGLNEWSYPFFRMGLELSDVDKVKSKLAQDTTIMFNNGYYSFVIPNVVLKSKDVNTNKQVVKDQRLYFHIEGNSIIITPLEGEKDFIPSYATVGVDFNYQNFLKIYSPKDIIDVFAMKKIFNDIPIDEFIINVESSTSEEVVLKGRFTLDTEENHMVAFPSLVHSLYNRFGFLF